MRVRKLLAMATMGVAATFAAAAPASAHGDSLIYLGKVDVTVTDIASGNTVTLLQNVSLLQAAQFCQVNFDVLSATLVDNDKAACKSKTTNSQKAWIHKH